MLRTLAWASAVAITATALLLILQHTTPAPRPCTPLPDPAVCVQLAWLDGAWRCITTEQAG